MEDIVSSKESVVSDCCESQCYKDVNEGINNSDIVSSIINLKNKEKEHVVKVFLNISMISI